MGPPGAAPLSAPEQCVRMEKELSPMDIHKRIGTTALFASISFGALLGGEIGGYKVGAIVTGGIVGFFLTGAIVRTFIAGAISMFRLTPNEEQNRKTIENSAIPAAKVLLFILGLSCTIALIIKCT